MVCGYSKLFCCSKELPGPQSPLTDHPTCCGSRAAAFNSLLPPNSPAANRADHSSYKGYRYS